MLVSCKAESIPGFHQFLQQVWFKTCHATGLNKTIPRLPHTDKGTWQGCPWRVWVELRSNLCSEGHGPGFGQISLEEEGLFVLGGHRTQKLYLIRATKREKNLKLDRCFAKILPQTICLLSCFILSQENLYYFILNLFYS